MLAHISTEYYVRLEQGRAPRPSADVLAGIVGALRLTGPESDHLHLLAGTAPNRSDLHSRQVRPSITGLLHRIPSTAGFVMSAAFDVLAWNDLAAALMENFAARTPDDRNLARNAFMPRVSDDATMYGLSDVAEFRQSAVMGLRSASARYPDDPSIRALVDELRFGSNEFARLWERNDVQPPSMLTKTFRHRVVGEITLDCDALHLVDGDQHLVLYTAPVGSAAAQSLAFLDALGADGVGVR